MDTANLSQLTVAKLRALCKKKGLSNYSKLPKAALLEKLEGGGLVSINSKQYSPEATTRKETQCGKGIVAVEAPSSDVGSLILTSDSLPSLCAEEGLESSTGAKLSRGEVLPLSSPRISALCATGSGIPTLTKSKRSNKTAFSTTRNPMVSKRRKVSFKVPEIPIPVPVTIQSDRNLAVNDLRICTPQSEITPLTSTTPNLLGHLEKTFQRDETIAKTLNATPISVPSLVKDSPSSPSILATALQGSASSITETAPFRKSKPGDLSASLSFVPPSFNSTRVLHQPRMGLSRNIVTSNRKFQSSASTSSSISESPSLSENTISNPSHPSPNLRVSNQDQMDGPRSQLSPRRTLASMPHTMEASILSSLKPITFPPSISQRKRLSLLSLALSYLGDDERTICVLVSKLCRYAVYLSAQDILKHNFSGKRFSSLICSLSTRGLTLNMTNLWPYLRLRQQEASQRKRAYLNGWVSKFIPEVRIHQFLLMAERLWKSPDHDEQFLVVQRFIQTRICFTLSFHGRGDASNRWIASTVVDAQEVLANEIWSITINESRSDYGTGHQEKTYYVLYQTCEVIGHPPSNRSAETIGGGTLLAENEIDSCRIPLRADWSAYIALRLPPATRHLYVPLMEHIRSTNTDDFERGVARGWIKRLRSQGNEGREKLLATERYILGCVVGNSISGGYRSSTGMALEWAGVSGARDDGKRAWNQSAQDVNLFLPERHNVESVHFTSQKGPLHPALMVVQTAGKQEGSFVLRENGVVIGEDEQVPEIWMKLLGCTAEGMAAT